MAEILTCPSCRRQLQVPESFIGQTVQCPECVHQFVAAVTSVSALPIPSAAPPQTTSAPPRPRRRDDDEDDIADRLRRGRFADDDDEDDELFELSIIPHCFRIYASYCPCAAV